MTRGGGIGCEAGVDIRAVWGEAVSRGIGDDLR